MDDARKLVEAQASSGLSIIQFVKQLGVGEQRFHSWKRKLGAGRKKKLAAISFAPVRVTAPMGLTTEAFPMEVVLENERRPAQRSPAASIRGENQAGRRGAVWRRDTRVESDSRNPAEGAVCGPCA